MQEKPGRGGLDVAVQERLLERVPEACGGTHDGTAGEWSEWRIASAEADGVESRGIEAEVERIWGGIERERAIKVRHPLPPSSVVCCSGFLPFAERCLLQRGFAERRLLQRRFAERHFLPRRPAAAPFCSRFCGCTVCCCSFASFPPVPSALCASRQVRPCVWMHTKTSAATLQNTLHFSLLHSPRTSSSNTDFSLAPLAPTSLAPLAPTSLTPLAPTSLAPLSFTPVFRLGSLLSCLFAYSSARSSIVLLFFSFAYFPLSHLLTRSAAAPPATGFLWPCPLLSFLLWPPPSPPPTPLAVSMPLAPWAVAAPPSLRRQRASRSDKPSCNRGHRVRDP